MTTDFRLIEAADATGSMQAAWVRSPVELIEDRINRSEPWSKAWRRAKCFQRAPYEVLKASQQALRQRLKQESYGSPAEAKIQ